MCTNIRLSFFKSLCYVFMLMGLVPTYVMLVAGEPVSVAVPAMKPGIYGQLAGLHIPSLINQDTVERAEIEKRNDAQNENIKKAGILGILKELRNRVHYDVGDVEAMRILYQVFQQVEQNDGNAKSFYLPNNVLHELSLFCGDKVRPEQHVFKFIDRTKTLAGTIELQKILARPITDIQTLRDRQAFIKTLLDNPALCDELDKQIDVFSLKEKIILWFFQSHDQASQQYFDMPYQGLLYKILGQGELGFGVNNFNDIVTMPVVFGVGPLVASLASTAAVFLARSQGRYWEANDLVGPAVGCGLMAAFYIPLMLHASITINNTSNEIHRKMIACGTLTNVACSVGQLVFEHEQLKKVLPSVERIKDIFEGTNQPKVFNELLATLDSETFTGDPTFWSKRGPILKAFKSAQTENIGFVNFMKFIGEVDAYLSIVKLYKEHKLQGLPGYCLVDYVETDVQAPNPKSHIGLVNYWHPMLDPKRVVTNSITLSDQPGTSKNMMVTGPNAGGKSTTLRAITIAVLLAQTIGIAPAQEMRMTPFSLIDVYLNPTDGTGFESQFQAEVDRIKQLFVEMEKLTPQQFSLITIDEPFTGTSHNQAEELSRRVINAFIKKNNNTAMIATHIRELTDLELKTNHGIMNYKVSIDRDAVGKIKFLYTIQPGISDQSIANELAEEQFGSFLR